MEQKNQANRINPESNRVKLFISHHHKDAEELESLQKKLDEYYVESFLAPRNIEIGENFLKKIRDELNSCAIFLLIGNKDSLNSPFVNQEIGFALGQNKAIISTIKEGNAPLGFLQHQQAINYKNISDDTFFEQLLVEIAKFTDENHYLKKKKNCLNILNIDENRGIVINQLKDSIADNNWYLSIETFNDYGFYTRCVLKQGNNGIAYIRLAHAKFPDSPEPKRRKNFPQKNNHIRDFLPENKFSYLDKNFFSYCYRICTSKKAAIQCLFNDIEAHEEIKIKYGNKSIIKNSLFRDI